MHPGKKLLLMIFTAACLTMQSAAQVLKPGFEIEEYIETLKINQKVHLSPEQWESSKELPDPQYFTFAYRSQKVAFDNIWDLWIHRSKPLAVIAVRGSIQTEASFLANLYAAMIPASGTLQLDPEFTFHYHLADDPRAAVHVGWFVAMAYLSRDIVHKIDSCYRTGVRDFILTGHSQGGGIVFLLTSYLYSLQREGSLPADIRFKTYCSAAPKPGNLFYAYDYESRTQEGWAYNVVNTEDWVPEVPFTVQTIDDFSEVNPFRWAKTMIRKQKFPKNLVLKHIYNRMRKPSLRARKNYQKYLGKMMSRAVQKTIPGFVKPAYYKSNDYVRTGHTIVLQPKEDYYRLFSPDPAHPDIWMHHLPKEYLYLAEQFSKQAQP